MRKIGKLDVYPKEPKPLRTQERGHTVYPPDKKATSVQRSHPHVVIRGIDLPPPPPREELPIVPPPNIRATEIRMRPIIDAVARRLTKPVGAALLFIAVLAQAQTTVLTAPQGNQGACPFPGCRGIGGIIDLSVAPYYVTPNFNGTTNTGTDNAPAINNAIAAACVAGQNAARPPEIRFPAGRILVASTLGILCNNLRFTGAANASTEIVGLASNTSGCGHGFPIFANRKATTRTCTAGTGSCDAPIGTSARGSGCPCYLTSDCQAGTCTGGQILTLLTMRDFQITAKNDCSVNLDLSLINSAEIDNVNMQVAGPFATGINNVNVLTWDDGIAGGGYHNIIMNSKLTSLTGLASTIIVWLRANDTFLLNNYLTGTGGNAIQIGISGGGPNAERIIGNTFEASAFAIEDHGGAVIYSANRFEGTGANVQMNITSDAHDTAISADNFFESVASPHIIQNGTRTTCGGIPCGTVAANACATSNPGIRYWDTNISNSTTDHGGMSCFCNGQATPRYCRDDTGACGASTTDCG